MPANHSFTIRMGAAHWDVTVKSVVPKETPAITFDLRAMDRSGRARFHREFMDAVRNSFRGKHRHQRRRAA